MGTHTSWASRPWAHQLSRRAILQAGTSTMLGAAATVMLPGPARGASPRTPAAAAAAVPGAQDTESLFRALDAQIEAAMTRYQIPGVAVGVYYRGQEHVRGYGVANVDYPQPVDGDTLFRIGSITKSFTGTIVMRLVEQGLLDLNAPVRTYLPGLRLADESVAARVTVRQLLNHSDGWLGEYYTDFGRGADALDRYVAGMAELPQLTPLGQVFAYNHAAVVLAGYLIEAVTGQPYEAVVREQVLDPLGLDHTRFFADEIVGYNVAASHVLDAGQPVVDRAIWRIWRTLHPTGGLISSARDLLRYARFQLGNRVTDGPPVLSPMALQTMRADPGPGGTLGVEINGVGVSWWQRATAEGVLVCQHGGDWPGQHSNLLFVPDREFALTILTNATSAPALVAELFLADDGALHQFAGLHNPPAVPLTLPAARLAPYEGQYWAREISPPPGDAEETWFELRAGEGRLRGRMIAGDTTVEFGLAFYRDNYVVALDTEGQPSLNRANFVPGPDGRIAWFSFGGRLHARQG